MFLFSLTTLFKINSQHYQICILKIHLLPWLSLCQISRVNQHAPNELFRDLAKEKVN